MGALTAAEIRAIARQAALEGLAELRHPLPAVKALDRSFVESVIAKREVYLRTLAAGMGLDPDAVVKRARASRDWSFPAAGG